MHGPAGVLDLVVPPEASVDDVAREYAAKAGLQFAPTLHSRLGTTLVAESSLADLGIRSGDVLAAGGAVRRHAGDHVAAESDTGPPGAFSVTWFTVAVAVAALAGWFGSRVGGLDSDEGQLTIGLLGFSAFLGVLPIGRLSAHRMVAAPAFAAAAAFAVVWAPEPERLPTVVGVTALVAAVTAGVARALDVQGDEALRVWIVVGVGLFLVTGAGALLDADPRVVWSLLLLAATLAARFVPAIAIDVPDQFLIDIERLAVTAWSARDRPHGRRGRTVVPPTAVAQVAARGSRIVTASAAGVWAVVAVSAPMLLVTADLARRPDRCPGHGRPLGRGAAPRGAQLPAPGGARHAPRRRPDLLGRADRRAARSRRPGAGVRHRASPASCWPSCSSWWPLRPAAAGARRGGPAAPRWPRAWPAPGRSPPSWWPPGCSARCGKSSSGFSQFSSRVDPQLSGSHSSDPTHRNDLGNTTRVAATCRSQKG